MISYPPLPARRRRIHFPFLLNVAKSAFMFTVRAPQLPSNGTAVFFFFGADAGPGEDSCLWE
ncbi:hypothetical protein D4R75_14190 [bacterium]|nr:MAG: hypothetical protein D4R75_14190 [bacterium]